MDEPLLLNSTHVSKLSLTGYSIDKIDYQSNPKFEFSGPLQTNITLGTNINVLDPDKRTAIISLTCKVFENAEENNYPFSMVISLSGRFTFNGDIDDEGFFNFCKNNGTAVLFPFMRAAIANVTVTANMQPLMLPLINVNEFLKDFEQGIKKESTPAAEESKLPG